MITSISEMGQEHFVKKELNKKWAVLLSIVVKISASRAPALDRVARNEFLTILPS